MNVNTGFVLDSFGYKIIPKQLGIDEKRVVSAIFHEADTDNKGHLTREDLKMAIAELFGYKPSKYEADQIMNEHGEDFLGKRGICLAEFMNIMEMKLSRRDEDEEIRHTFMSFDSQCRGFLTVDDLKKAFSKVAPHIPHHIVESTFRELDRDGDGRVSYKDFEFMMKYDTGSH